MVVNYDHKLYIVTNYIKYSYTLGMSHVRLNFFYFEAI